MMGLGENDCQSPSSPDGLSENHNDQQARLSDNYWAEWKFVPLIMGLSEFFLPIIMGLSENDNDQQAWLQLEEGENYHLADKTEWK